MNDILLEICIATVQSAEAAQAGGAHRVELCDNLLEGGTTPSYGMVATVRDRLWIALNVIVRPRGGDFLYDDTEFEVMKRDVIALKKLGVDGIVTGVLTADGGVDVARTRELVELASPLPVTFHRAFDVCADPMAALEDVIASGCTTLLTSGQAPSALEGATLLAQLVEVAGTRLTILAGAGVRVANIGELAATSGCIAFHSSARAAVPSTMVYRNERVKMGAPGQDEYSRLETSPEVVAELLANARAALNP
ncbi:copper homeostasis protein CutC [Chitinibacteraceae bacterium HSL-7]